MSRRRRAARYPAVAIAVPDQPAEYLEVGTPWPWTGPEDIHPLRRGWIDQSVPGTDCTTKERDAELWDMGWCRVAPWEMVTDGGWRTSVVLRRDAEARA